MLLKVARDTSQVVNANKASSGKPTGLIVDESAHLKKGNKSVGVSKQYAGVVGMVENSQVGIYASMVNDNRAVMVNERLFIPEKWVKDKPRCKQASIPKEHIEFKTKLQLALEMIDQLMDEGVEFDWIGGDGLYGHNRELRNGLDQRELFYVLDVHKDEKIFTERPIFAVHENNKRGRPSKKPKPNISSIRLDQYASQLNNEDWCVEKKIRKPIKGRKN
ncbi:MAG: transposase [Cytophagales bacterium]|nr:transposase [Cytophagales bacterium]